MMQRENLRPDVGGFRIDVAHGLANTFVLPSRTRNALAHLNGPHPGWHHDEVHPI